MKHGPNALIDERLPCSSSTLAKKATALQSCAMRKTHSNIVEVKAREGIVISVLTEGDSISSVVSDHVIEIPAASDLLSPILSIIPLQLLAYHIAVRRGCDVDQPAQPGQVRDRRISHKRHKMHKRHKRRASSMCLLCFMCLLWLPLRGKRL
jgi:glucosamine 6-phosphate synthetase-like amidotransferase/phosphosugar isomerase protein